MLGMIIKMSLVTLLYVAITVALKLWIVKDNTKITNGKRIFVGLLYGVCAILSTHYGVIYEHMALNVRDIAPLAAGLFFAPISGIIAGLIGGGVHAVLLRLVVHQLHIGEHVRGVLPDGDAVAHPPELFRRLSDGLDEPEFLHVAG